jgi:hypothetical protein
MKVSYSKLLVHGVIATALLMSMSCQKKGSARGVQPTTGTKKEAPEANNNVKDKTLENIPGARDQAVLTSGDPSKAKPQADLPEADAEEVVAKTTSADNAVAAPVTKKNSEEKIAEGQPGSESNPIVLPEVKVAGKKKASTEAETKTASKACSEAVVKASTQMTSLYNKIVEVDKLSSTPEADRIANYTAYHQLCLDWPKLFTTEKIESCESEGRVRTAHSANLSCVKFSLALKDLTGKENVISSLVTKARNERMAQLRATKLVVSDEAKELFAKENTSWKMFIVDGELQTDSAKLTDALKANKVACTIAVPALDKYTHAQNVIVSITAATELMATDEADPVQKGVELAIRMKASDKEATAAEAAKATEEKSVMLCSNIDHKDVNTKALAKALGKHIAVAVAAPTTEEKETPQVEEKKEEAVKQK